MGFLSSLGVRFLRLLYSVLIPSESSAVFVARADGVTVGFIAGTRDTGEFYRDFLRRHFFSASWTLLPWLLRPRTLLRIFETVRHGVGDGRADAELLSMAVAPAARRRGLGREFIETLLSWASATGVDSMKVVVGSTNIPAVALYEGSGFEDAQPKEVHRHESSVELVWRA